jgi:hypothetical protein
VNCRNWKRWRSALRSARRDRRPERAADAHLVPGIGNTEAVAAEDVERRSAALTRELRGRTDSFSVTM